MILGEDWLEGCSPMWVHWTKKIMGFMHKGARVTLRGIKPEVTRCSTISAGRLKELLRRHAVTHCVQFMPKPVAAINNMSIDQSVFSVTESDMPDEI